MNIVIINKSDSTGGAAVVSRRLMEALREHGEDARMLVCEKITDSPYVEQAGSRFGIKKNFIFERLKIFIANGFNRNTLFKIDTGEEGLPLWQHPLVINADAILLNWINQGMLSLKGVSKILKLGKPVIWTMHDMWCFTGICHHAGVCNHFRKECGNCPLLESKASKNDLSHKIWLKKNTLFSKKQHINKMAFVAVSNWLKEKATESSLLKNQKIEVIPNAFNLPSDTIPKKSHKSSEKIRILFGAARLDDPIKGLDTLKMVSHKIKESHPDIAAQLEIAVFGNVRNPEALKDFSLPLVNLGLIKGEKELRKIYQEAHIVVSASSYETLPGTLVEAQAFGCIPVSFNQGGQSDIIKHLSTGYIAEYNEDISSRSKNLSDGIIWASSIINSPTNYPLIIDEMRKNVDKKFSYPIIALNYISLIKEINAIY